MNKLAAFAILLFSFNTFAAQSFECRNPSGAQLTITRGSPADYFSMNEVLWQSLTNQGSNSVQRSGEGAATWTDGAFYFSAGTPKGWTLSLSGDQGGMKLRFATYSDYSTGRGFVNYYFHPGECRFSVN